MDDGSLSAVAEALTAAGFEPEVGVAPRRWESDPVEAGVFVRVPGEDVWVVVKAGVEAYGQEPRLWWRELRTAGAEYPYGISFHEEPFRTRGHGWAAPAGYAFGADVNDVVTTVREWSRWEIAWLAVPKPVRRLAHDRHLAASKLEGGAIPVVVELDPELLGRVDAVAVRGMIDELFLPGIRWRFPRDRTGAGLAKRLQVLLHEFRAPDHPSRKGIWLVVDGPVPRGEQVLTVRLELAAGRGAWHRWDGFPEYWRWVTPRSLDELWGAVPEQEEITGLLLQGEIRQALDASGVGVDRGTGRLLSGLPDCLALSEYTEKWVTNAVAMLTTAAPWRWRDAVGRGRPQRIGNLGGFNPSRRPGLFLQHTADGPMLSLDQSASPLVLPRESWARDPDYDLVRSGLLTPDQIPLPGPTSHRCDE